MLAKGAKPVHDEQAAVNYLVFDEDQWISYDDEVTFKQKVDWVNKVGLGGSLIWASDLDDDEYSAHSALLQRQIAPTSQLQDVAELVEKAQTLSLTESVKGQTGEQCFKYKGKCKDLNDNEALAEACGPGNNVVGWDDAGCGKKNHHYGKPICCPVDGAPTSCQWRGNSIGGVGGDCSGACYEGEINVAGISSSWGGGFVNDGDTDKCRRGYKSFCCVALDYAAITKDCSFTPCGGSCLSSENAMFKYHDDCWFGRYRTYCCVDPSPVNECHWVGDGGDCANVHCDVDEIELARDPYGDPYSDSASCSWGRDKAACYKIGQIELDTEPATCSTDLCKYFPGYCDSDKDGSPGLSKRHGSDESGVILDKRAGYTNYDAPPAGYPKGLMVRGLPYPGPSTLFNSKNLAFKAIPIAFRAAQEYCVGPAIAAIKVPFASPESIGLTTLDTEHVIDVSHSMRLSHMTSYWACTNNATEAGDGIQLRALDVHRASTFEKACSSYPGFPVVVRQVERQEPHPEKPASHRIKAGAET